MNTRFGPYSEPNQTNKFQVTISQTIKIEDGHKKDLITQCVKRRNPRESNHTQYHNTCKTLIVWLMQLWQSK